MPGSTTPAARRARDRETIELMLRRDLEGLERLLNDCVPRIRWVLQKEFALEFGPSEIDQTINIAALRAWRSAHSFDPRKGSLRAWFYVIARNEARVLLEKERRARLSFRGVSDWEETSFRLSRRQGALRGPKQDRFVRDLQACIQKLPPTQMAIIKADLLSGHVASAADLARSLQTSKNSIYASRSIARKTLRRELTRLGHHPDKENHPEKGKGRNHA